MEKQQQARYNMLKAVRDFGITHRDRFPESSIGGQAFATIAQAAADIDNHAAEKILAAKEGQRTRRVARAELKAAMLDIARTARAASRRSGDRKNNKLTMPRRDSNVSLIQVAGTFITEGQALLDELVPLGLSPTAFTDLRTLSARLEKEIDGRVAARATVAHGQHGIDTALDRGMDAVFTLDAVVANALKDDPAWFAGWLRARRVIDGRSKASQGADASSTAASTSAAVAPIDPTRKAS